MSENPVQRSDADELKRSAGDLVGAIASNLGQRSAGDPATEPLDQFVDHLRQNSDLTENDAISIQLGRRKVFQLDEAGEASYKQLTSPERRKIAAFQEGEPIQGSLRVYVNRAEQPALQVKAGEVVHNEIQYRSEVQQQETSRNSIEPPEQKTEERSIVQQLELLQKELAATQAALEQTNRRLAMVEQRQVTLANPKLSQWVNGIQQKYQAHLQKLGDRLENKVTQTQQAIAAKVNEGREFVQGKVDQGKQSVTSKLDEGKQFVQQRVEQGKQAIAQAWMKTVVEPSLAKIAQSFGTDMPDGAKVFRTQEYQITQQGNATHIFRNDGTRVTPDNLNGRDQKVLMALSDKAEKIGTQQSKKVTTPSVRKAVKPRL
ncbi:hypothetical protein [Lyngbya confervoides]|uniref:Uncharacterized protein n=1 Tax=Lyngbya confervoides BDU141951 TaxID=1574623 RepID=A0ABD4TA74_9CYAN|nr:hypothetical protein [Lyngbya confervoides]MCM1985090.1 hypothetical protein [Lyngbya confervoides BDU141951]